MVAYIKVGLAFIKSLSLVQVVNGGYVSSQTCASDGDFAWQRFMLIGMATS